MESEAMQPFTELTCRPVPLPSKDVDTDQIIPAQYLKVVDKNGLADGLFRRWRFDEDGKPVDDFVLNNPVYQGARILLTGDNFGCGSSREHAPWALQGWGFRAVISTSFADIFRSNALKNGLLPVEVDEETHQALFDLAEESTIAEIEIDLENQTLTLPNGQQAHFPIDPFSKRCLLEGIDPLGYLMQFKDQTAAYEAAHETTA
jgi:3-isopropylmalate/(R)-2-methylmalate dehydratase small subunit